MEQLGHRRIERAGHDLGGHRLAADADEALHAGTAAGGAVRVGEECKIDTLEDFFK